MSLNLSSNFLQFKIEMANGSKHGVYEFDEFRLDAAKLMLYREGREISLPPKVIETLLVLVENRGEIIGKDELMNRIWADAAVEESNLSQYLYLLRKTLGNRSDGTPFIETLRRRGYRFNGEARFVENHQPTNSAASVNTAYAPRFGIERQGNVLKLTDWNHQAEKPETEYLRQTDAAENNSRTKQLSTGKLAVGGIAAALALAVSLSFLLFNQGRNAATATGAEKRSEMTVERLTNGNVPLAATISPDGNYFVYHETDGETSSLWLQQTGGSSRIEIIQPLKKFMGDKTFSPDGAFVYFTVRDNANAPWSLYRVSTLGGAQTKILTDINSPVSFSPGGKEMVFQRSNQQTGESSLVIAASDGKEERILLSRAREQEILQYPAWSPDGGRIAFTAIYPQGELPPFNRIAAVNLQTSAIETLSPEKWDNCLRIVWTGDGQGLIFIGTKYGEGMTTRRDQVYYLQPATGEARRLTTDGNRHGVASLGITNDDAVIAVPYSRSSQIWRMSPDGDARTAMQITNGQADGRAGLVPLADGRVGYITRAGENLSVWLMNDDGANQRQLINDPSQPEELRAAADGSFFVFTSEQSDKRRHLFRVDADGANLRQLTFGDTSAGDSTVSPNGNWIVYHTGVLEGGLYKHSLWKIPAAGGEAVRFGDTDCTTPHFSPDGKSLSCIRHEKEILIISATDGALLKTFETVKSSTLNVGARWTADGENVVYIVHQKNVGNLWVQPTNGATARRLTDFTSGNIYNFAFSPDGARLYVARGYQINDAILVRNFK